MTSRQIRESDHLQRMADEVAAVNRDKGWYESERTFGDDIALLHSEVSEALEAFRDHRMERWVTPKTGADGLGGRVVLSEGMDYPSDCKPEGVGSELADVLVRLLDTAHRYDVDLFKEWRAKVDFNKTRPARHGGKAL